MPVALPLKSIFATPLQIRALDTRLGGWLKPVVGTRWINGWMDGYLDGERDGLMDMMD